MSRLLVLVLSLTACNDYALNPKGDVEDGGIPEISVTPEAVTAVVCDVEERTVTITNLGDGRLDVDGLSVEGSGWSLLENPAPFSLEVNEGRAVLLEAGVGNGALVIESNDPERGRLQVPLTATADQPPTVSISAPVYDAVLDMGVAVDLRGEARDAEDSATALSVRWLSDVDGEVANAPPAASGEVVDSWADPSDGPHLLTLEVTDTCGNAAEASIPLCRQAGYAADELVIGSWHFEGSARWDSGQHHVELTTPTTNQVGSAFQTAQTVNGGAVSIRFAFYIGGGDGADGLSLTTLDTNRMTGFLGGTGCGIGYGGDAACTSGPALPGWSIEVDTYFNDGQDPTAADHVMFTFDGDVDDPAAWAELPEMEDTGWHTMEVEVNAPHVTVRIDEVPYIDAELPGFYDFPAYVGFTAGTGGSTNYHLIRSLEVTEYACE